MCVCGCTWRCVIFRSAAEHRFVLKTKKTSRLDDTHSHDVCGFGARIRVSSVCLCVRVLVEMSVWEAAAADRKWALNGSKQNNNIYNQYLLNLIWNKLSEFYLENVRTNTHTT